jgi:tetratricopeptide (TPR) repeat protein
MKAPQRSVALALFLVFCSIPASGQGGSQTQAIDEGLRHFKAAEYDKASKVFQKITHADPHNAFAFYVLGLSYSHLKKYEEAAAAVRRSLELNPEPLWGNITPDMVKALLREVEQNARLKRSNVKYHYDKFKDITVVSTEVGEFPGGLSVDASFLFKGRMTITPAHLILYISSTSRRWQFLEPASRELNAIVDGERVSLGYMERVRGDVRGSRYSVTVSELLALPVPYDTFRKLTRAHVVEMQVGFYEFRLNNKHLARLQDLLGETLRSGGENNKGTKRMYPTIPEDLKGKVDDEGMQIRP